MIIILVVRNFFNSYIQVRKIRNLELVSLLNVCLQQKKAAFALASNVSYRLILRENLLERILF